MTITELLELRDDLISNRFIPSLGNPNIIDIWVKAIEDIVLRRLKDE